MAVPPHHFDDEPAESQPGGLLGELERRQDDVLDKLDELDAKLSEVLKGLEPGGENGTADGTKEGSGIALGRPTGDVGLQLSDLVDALEEDAAVDETAPGEADDFESADDWA
ncbi:hypothetical protein [Planctomycetes bacterium TBK1r]|uniref:Uncharacterized protein n=1 Tax=Stieleria magnilauensis TaxID=2527963 RepID=A0ABX5Y4X1_9BACT|nr:hypothetical protein TBK1r_61870 [Planctomycetes bacterium TBK1r]